MCRDENIGVANTWCSQDIVADVQAGIGINWRCCSTTMGIYIEISENIRELVEDILIILVSVLANIIKMAGAI